MLRRSLARMLPRARRVAVCGTIRRMKRLLLLSALLLVAAIGIFTSVRVRQAAEARHRWAQSARERLLLEGEVDNDRLGVRSAELDEEIAEGRGKKPDRVATERARQKLRNDELLLKIMDDGDRFNATLE